MLRRVPVLCCAALNDAINKVEKVWNARWDGKPTTHEMNFNNEAKTNIPLFHVLSLDGKLENKKYDPKMPKATAVRLMTAMVKQNMADRVLLEAQRQGRISFYMTAAGEEAESGACTAALDDDDMIYMQYRESPVMMYRGWGIKEMIAQCMGNCEDKLRGRQMPIHYGDTDLNVQMVSSPLCTQVPQAAGTGYVYALEGANRICSCFVGDGAASEGDFQAGLNFASTLGCQTLFFVRNNGFAISTPAVSQYSGDGIIGRGIAFGMPSIRIDGNDALAVYAATKRAREIILKDKRPVLIETMSYRVGHHSTSDDSTAYRQREEMAHFDNVFSPIKRFGNYLEALGWWTPAMTKKIQDETMQECQAELARQEKLPAHPPEMLFEDTFSELTPNLIRQKEETMKHYEANKDKYAQH